MIQRLLYLGSSNCEQNESDVLQRKRLKIKSPLCCINFITEYDVSYSKHFRDFYIFFTSEQKLSFPCSPTSFKRATNYLAAIKMLIRQTLQQLFHIIDRVPKIQVAVILFLKTFCYIDVVNQSRLK